MKHSTDIGDIFLGDCLQLIKNVRDNSVDMVLTDLPYAMTDNSWDEIIPFSEMWGALHRVCKKSAAMVFTASQPFTTSLIGSNTKNFRCEWIWEKSQGTNFIQAKRHPLKVHENIIMFSQGSWVYNPQFTKTSDSRNGKLNKKKHHQSSNYGGVTVNCDTLFEKEKIKRGTYKKDIYRPDGSNPRSVLSFSNSSNKDGDRGFHPTQKPLSLFEYMILTYSNVDDLVLDLTAGSCTTAVAAINTKRRYLCFEINREYFNVGQKRVEAAVPGSSLRKRNTLPI